MGACLKWSPRPDLNWWPPPYQGDALPTELHGQMVGMPGLEPGNPEGADLQSAAVAAVPHPHSLFKHLRARIALTSRKDNRGREKCCQSNPPNRAYLYHNSSTYMRCGGTIHPLTEGPDKETPPWVGGACIPGASDGNRRVPPTAERSPAPDAAHPPPATCQRACRALSGSIPWEGPSKETPP